MQESTMGSTLAPDWTKVETQSLVGFATATLTNGILRQLGISGVGLTNVYHPDQYLINITPNLGQKRRKTSTCGTIVP